MVGSKPNAYLTEEARLEAQRRMLAERYGLLSDDSDEGEDATDGANKETPANGISNGDATHPDSREANGGDSDLAPDASASGDCPAPSDAATYGEGSSVHGSDLAMELPQDNTSSDQLTAAGAEQRLLHPTDPRSPPSDRAPGWPGVEVHVDTPQGKRIAAKYEYKTSNHKDAVSKRDLRVSQIAVYNSQYLEKHTRKIAVNDNIITYAVGGHIRAILRNSTVRALLKGHGSAVADIEFLYAQEKEVEPNSGCGVSVLGSVADDGSVYVWKLVRNYIGSEETLEVADAIRFEHSDIDEGRSYRRIAFRPGPNSIIAEKGIGVAMILIDAKSPDVRVVELVKMNDKMMVRDKFLKAHNEVDSKQEKKEPAPIDSAAWLSERIIATSRCGKVYLWNADSTLSACIARLPREKSTRVTSLHSFNQDALLLVVDSGRELEVWVATGFAPNISSTSLELRQTIRLYGDDPTDLYTVTSVDPFERLVMLSNVKGNSFFVLHYNPVAQAFDAITEVPVKQPILSFCMTRNRRAPSSPISGQILDSEPIEEVGIWCVQPRGIQLIHLPVRDCGPRTLVRPEVYPKSTQKSVIRKPDKSLPTSDVIATSGPAPSAATKETYRERLAPPQPAASRRQPASTFDKTMANQGGAASVVSGGSVAHTRTVPHNASPAPVQQPIPVNQSAKKPVLTGLTQPPPVPSTHIQPLSAPVATAEPEIVVHPDDVADSILEAAKKAIAAFDHGAGQRSSSDKAKMDRLIDSVTDTAKTNLERFVNSSMKKILAETLIPGMSKIIADTRVAMKENTRVDPKVTADYFETALEKSSISKSFTNACQEMERQVTASVTQSMSSKYETLVTPVIGGVKDAAEDLAASVSMLRKQIGEMKPDRAGGGIVVEIGTEDIQRTIEEEIERGNVDGAFQTALDKEDLSLVTWLCRKFEVGNFFEIHTLSQDSLISLAQQLGHGLSDGEVELKVEWLRELMLVLEPESDEFDAIALETIKQLVGNVNELRQNKAVLDQYEGLEKNLKTLSRLIASHIPNN